MSNPSKAKGTRWEVELVEYLRTQGAPHAERLALGGSNDRGDVTGTPGVTWEAKSCKALDLAGWLDELTTEMSNARTTVGAVVHKRRGRNVARAYCTLDLETFCILLREAGYLGERDV